MGIRSNLYNNFLGVFIYWKSIFIFSKLYCRLIYIDFFFDFFFNYLFQQPFFFNINRFALKNIKKFNLNILGSIYMLKYNNRLFFILNYLFSNNRFFFNHFKIHLILNNIIFNYKYLLYDKIFR